MERLAALVLPDLGGTSPRARHKRAATNRNGDLTYVAAVMVLSKVAAIALVIVAGTIIDAIGTSFEAGSARPPDRPHFGWVS